MPFPRTTADLVRNPCRRGLECILALSAREMWKAKAGRGGAGWVARGSEGVDPWRKGSLPLGNEPGTTSGNNGASRGMAAGGDELLGLRRCGETTGAGACSGTESLPDPRGGHTNGDGPWGTGDGGADRAGGSGQSAGA